MAMTTALLMLIAVAVQSSLAHAGAAGMLASPVLASSVMISRVLSMDSGLQNGMQAGTVGVRIGAAEISPSGQWRNISGLKSRFLCLRGGGGEPGRLSVRKVKGPSFTQRRSAAQMR